MNPLIKFHSIVLAITTFIVFSLWEALRNVLEYNFSLIIPIAAITTIGFYRVVMFFVEWLILKIRFIKMWIFGAYYMEGVWVGFFIGKEDKVRFYIETFEQDFESITIRGKGFRENEGYFGYWVSDSVNFDVKKGVLNYTYQTDALSNSFINPGLAYFNIERKEQQDKPYRLVGFSADLYNPKKLKSFEEKINDKPDIDNIENALGKAKELYNNNKYFLPLSQRPPA